MIENVTIGSDVEYFVRNTGTGEIISAEGLIKGTKENPFKFDPNNDFFATSLDNVLAEGNIPPAMKPSEFYAYLQQLRMHIDKELPMGFITSARASARLDPAYLQTHQAKVFGCDPSLNAWTGESVQPVPKGDNLRSAGFHVHIGYKDPDEDTNYVLAKACDLFLGVPSVILEPYNERKRVGYGLAGNFRHQRHGCEYRSLSSHFASSQPLIEWVFESTMRAIDALNNGLLKGLNEWGDVIQDTINNEKLGQAKKLIDMWSQMGVSLPSYVSV